ncbi:MAG TPA: type 4 pilus major pilin, partial [Pyrinomonadaceae bacterium]|nr:type 4 pilus major pilin [Pyrinomonadaceae bacterium]
DFLRRKTRSRAISHGIAMLIALGMVLGWRGYQYLTRRLSTPEEFAKWMAIAKDISNMLRTHIVYRPLSHTWEAWQLAWDLFGPYLLSFILGLLAIGLLRCLFRVPVKWLNWESSAQKTLLAASALWCFWYFILSGPDASNRHLLSGIIFLELLTVNFAHQLWAPRVAPSTDSPNKPAAEKTGDPQSREARNAFLYRYPIAAIVTGAMIWGVWWGITYNRGAQLESKRLLGAQLEVATWVRNNIPKDSAISGWGWFVPWHISFLADRMPARANIHTASLEGMTDWLVIPPEISAEGPNKRRQSFLEHQAHLEFSNGGYLIYRVSHRPEDQPQTTAQLKAIFSNAKNWKAAGHNYSELNRARAIADGVVPAEMIIHNGIQNLFGGPVDIGPAPAHTGIPDTFLVLFSGVPNADCVKLAFPAPDGFVAYAGDYLRIAASEDQARSLCTTGNMWFVAK